MFETAQKMGISVIRVWAFNDGETWNALQPRMGHVDERVLMWAPLPVACLRQLSVLIASCCQVRSCSMHHAAHIIPICEMLFCGRNTSCMHSCHVGSERDDGCETTCPPKRRDGLDWVVNEARKHGLRLIMVLTDSQGDYGGMAQYVRWAGPLTENVRDFYTSKRIRVSFPASVDVVAHGV